MLEATLSQSLSDFCRQFLFFSITAKSSQAKLTKRKHHPNGKGTEDHRAVSDRTQMKSEAHMTVTDLLNTLVVSRGHFLLLLTNMLHSL